MSWPQSTSPLVLLAGCAGLIAWPRSAAAQVSGSLSASNVSPIFANWSTNASQFTLVLTNGNRLTVAVNTRARLDLNGDSVGAVSGEIFSIPAGTSTYNGTQIALWDATSFTSGVATVVNATGRLPGGSWQLCVVVDSVNGNHLAQPCATFAVAPPAIQLSLSAANVSPIPADWASGNMAFTLVASSNIGKTTDVQTTVGLYLLNGPDGTLVGSTTSLITSVPNGVSTYTHPQIGEWAGMTFTGVTNDTVKATGRLPAGTYQMCVTMTSTNTTPEFPTTQGCGQFTVAPAQIQATLAAAAVSPIVAQWATNAAQFTLVTTSNVGKAVEVGVAARILKDGVQVGTAPGVLTSLPNGTASFTSLQIADWSQLAFTGPVGQTVANTGRLPDGSYQVFLDISSANPTPEFPATSPSAMFSVITPGGVTATLIVPNPTPYVADWQTVSSVMSLVVTNTTGAAVTGHLALRLLQGDQQVGTVPGSIESIPAAVATNFTSPQIADWSGLSLVGPVATSVAQTGRLPEGAYQLCAEFTQLSTGTTSLSDAGSCALFQVAYPQPPILISPADESDVPSQYPVLQWTPVVSVAVPQVAYHVRVVEVLQGQNPVQAMQSNVPVLDTSVTAVTALTYPPAAFPLETGKTFAWQVQALRAGVLGPPQPVGQDNGRSTVASFTRPAVVVVMPPPGGIQPPPTGGKPPSGVVKPPSGGFTPYWNASLAGTLQYSFSPSDVPEPQHVSAFPTGMPYVEAMGGQQLPPAMKFGGYTQPIPHSGGTVVAGKRALAGVTVRLVVRYQAGGKRVWGTSVAVNGKVYHDANTVIATATTGSDGKFSFLFTDDNPTGLLGLGASASWGGGDFTDQVQGAIVTRFYNLEVGDQHYLNPSDELTLGPNKSQDVGTLVSLVRSYRFTVRLVQFGTQSAPAPVRLQVLRLTRPPGVPANEGTAAEPRTFYLQPLVIAGKLGALKYEVLAEQSSGNGSTTFSKLVKNVGPADEYQLRVSSDPDAAMQYREVFLSFARAFQLQLGSSKPWDDAYYNEQYQQLADTLKLVVIPKPPRYAGRALRMNTANPVPKGLALLFSNGTFSTWRAITPGDSGRFVFDSLKSQVNYRVIVHAEGFKPDTFNVGSVTPGALIKHTHDMQPNAYVRGRVVNEDSLATFAYVRLEDEPETATYPVWKKATPTPSGQGDMILLPGLIQQTSGGPSQQQQQQSKALMLGNLTFGAQQQLGPSGKGTGTVLASQADIPVLEAYEFASFASSGKRRMILDAGPKYFTDTTNVTIPSGNKDLGTFTVYRRLHRVKLRVLEQPASGPKLTIGCTGTGVKGAIVQLAVGGTHVDTTDAQGWVEFTWDNPVDQTTFKITGPPDKDYVYAEPQLTIPVSRTPLERCARIKVGGRISGVVYAGTSDSAPVPGARVFVQGEGPLFDALQTTTGPDGRYVLRSVPPGTRLVRAGKSKSKFIGDSLSLGVQAGQITAANFHLRFYEGMDITQLLGFPLEVHSLTELAQGVRISGSFPEAPTNPTFTLDDPKTVLDFDSVTIVPQGAGDSTAVPKAGRVALNDSYLDLHLFGSADYLVRQGTTAGLQLRDRGAGVGAVYGPIELRKQSFAAVTDAELRFVDAQDAAVPLQLLLPNAQGDARTLLASLTADAAAPVGPDGYQLGTTGGATLPFRLFQFRADANPASSWVRQNGVHLAATLHTDIPGVGDLAVQVPDLPLVPGAGTGKGITYPISGQQAINATLQQWQLQADAWSISGLGVVQLSKGKIVAQLVSGQPSTATQFPFLGMTLTPTGLSGGSFGNGPILLGGIAPMALPEGLIFTREGDTGPWALIGKNAILGGLPAMGPNDAIQLSTADFRSSGEKTLSLKNDQAVTLYHTAAYAISAMSFDEKSVTLVGSLDLAVPGLPQNGASVFYTKGTGGPVFNMVPASWDPIDVNGAMLKITNGTLDTAGFHSAAQVYVPQKFSVASHFDRTPPSGTNSITVTPLENATIDVGEIQIGKLSGGATVANGAWQVAWNGTVTIGDQMSGPMSVAVEGANITAGAADFSVKNISTPFGNITVTIDFPQQRVTGQLQIDGDMTTGLHANGTAEVVLGGKPGQRYWYFFAGANFQLNSPTLGGQAAFLVGDVQMSGDLLSKFSAYSTKGVPESFHDINGFFLDGKIVVPVPVCPNGGFDIGVASVGVWCDVWGDLRLGANFQDNNIYHIGELVGIGAGVKASFGLGMCVSVWGSASMQQDAEGEYRSDGAWYVWGQYDVTVHGGASYGVGVDDVCLDYEKSYSIDLGAEGQVGYNWNTSKGAYFTVYFK